MRSFEINELITHFPLAIDKNLNATSHRNKLYSVYFRNASTNSLDTYALEVSVSSEISAAADSCHGNASRARDTAQGAA